MNWQWISLFDVLSAWMGMPLAAGEDRDLLVGQGRVALRLYENQLLQLCGQKSICVRIKFLLDPLSEWLFKLGMMMWDNHKQLITVFCSIFPPAAVLSIKGDDQGKTNETQTLLRFGSLVLAPLCFHSISCLMLKPWVGFYTASTQLCQFCTDCNAYWLMELVLLYSKSNISNVQYNSK